MNPRCHVAACGVLSSLPIHREQCARERDGGEKGETNQSGRLICDWLLQRARLRSTVRGTSSRISWFSRVQWFTAVLCREPETRGSREC